MIAHNTVALVAAIAFAATAPAAGPQVGTVFTQQVDGVVYFRLHMEFHDQISWGSPVWPPLGPPVGPRLLPQDATAYAVHHDGGLTFVGKLTAYQPARFVLLYPTAPDPKTPAPLGLAALRPPGTIEAPVVVNFAQTRVIREPDLRREWTEARVKALAALERQAPDFAFLRFARIAAQRRYGVASTANHRAGDRPLPGRTASFYDLTAGGAALSESLATHRLLGSSAATRTATAGRAPCRWPPYPASRSVDTRGRR